MLDADLAGLYGMSTKRLNEQVNRNSERFPEDFMFQLSAEEIEGLRSQFATSKGSRDGRRYRGSAFTRPISSAPEPFPLKPACIRFRTTQCGA